LVLPWILRLVTAAGLAVDAYIHADLASRYDPNTGTGALSQGELFHIEAIVSALAALLILLSSRFLAWALAAAVAVSALCGLLIYLRYDHALGPLPDMYEPYMYPEKAVAAAAEAVAVVTALAGLACRASQKRHQAP
jgi:hypothetical protein